MENASKALIIAGVVLVGVIIISMGVLLSAKLQKTARTYYTSMTTNEIQKFNSDITKNFIIENGNTYITAQGIITLKNILNTEKYDSVTTIPNIKEITKEGKFLKDNGTNVQEYKIINIEYKDGMIKSIIINININDYI